MTVIGITAAPIGIAETVHEKRNARRRRPDVQLVVDPRVLAEFRG